MRRALFAAIAALTAGCGMGVEPEATAGTGQDALYRDQLAPAAATLEYEALQRVERCTDSILRPQLTGTLREMVQLRTREVLAEVGDAVQSSYRNTTGEDEEIRRGIAEFEVHGDISRALLRFKESRTVWPYPVPTDTHRISVYAADFKATIDDFADPAVGVARFETDVNSLPAQSVTADVTRAVQSRMPYIGFRFELENLPGSGTQFDDVELVLRTCRLVVREL